MYKDIFACVYEFMLCTYASMFSWVWAYVSVGCRWTCGCMHVKPWCWQDSTLLTESGSPSWTEGWLLWIASYLANLLGEFPLSFPPFAVITGRLLYPQGIYMVIRTRSPVLKLARPVLCSPSHCPSPKFYFKGEVGGNRLFIPIEKPFCVNLLSGAGGCLFPNHKHVFLKNEVMHIQTYHKISC